MNSRTYFVCKVKQRQASSSVELAIFVASTKDILEWAGIRRVGEQEKGTQRILKQTRVNAVQKFLTVNEENTIPTSVILAFLPSATTFSSLQESVKDCITDIDTRNNVGEKLEWGTLSFRFKEGANEYERPALIVDGQHRLEGMAKIDEEIPVLVVALLDATLEEQAFQFVVINNKAAKVPTDNVKGIIADINEEDLKKRLAQAGVNYKDTPATLLDIDSREDSPFKKLLDWPLNERRQAHIDNGVKLVNLNTIEASLRYIRNTIPGLIEDDDEDTLREIFICIWKAAKEVFKDLWSQNDKFMSKVNINAVNEYVVDRIEGAMLDGNVEVYDPENVQKYARTRLEEIPPEYWRSEWIKTLQDSAPIRNLIKSDLRQIAHNVRSPREREWYDGLSMIGGDIQTQETY